MNTLNTTRHSLRCPTALVALFFGLAATYAVAGETDEAPSVQVSYADLDLSKPAGAETLYRRIEGAARSVCGPRHSRNLNQVQAFRTCYKNAIEDALQQVNESLVFAVHRNKTGKPASG